MSSAADRAVVDDYVDALLAPIEALHAEPCAVALPATPPVAARAPVDTPAAPVPAPAAPPAARAPMPSPPQAFAPAPPRAREPATAAAARVATAIADATSPDTAAPAVAKPARWLRVSVDHDRYAVELLRVQEVVRMAPIVGMRGAAVAVLGVMNLRGRIVPVYDLGLWLGAGEVRPDERARIVVVERDDELLGVLVSSVDDVVTLAEDGIEPTYACAQKRRAADRAIRGIARPGGLPTVLLDANALFE